VLAGNLISVKLSELCRCFRDHFQYHREMSRNAYLFFALYFRCWAGITD